MIDVDTHITEPGDLWTSRLPKKFRDRAPNIVSDPETGIETWRIGDGELTVGDTAVLVAAASAHRAEAFEAARVLMERLKQDVPIWKREVGPDGDEWVSDRP